MSKKIRFGPNGGRYINYFGKKKYLSQFGKKTESGHISEHTPDNPEKPELPDESDAHAIPVEPLPLRVAYNPYVERPLVAEWAPGVEAIVAARIRARRRRVHLEEEEEEEVRPRRATELQAEHRLIENIMNAYQISHAEAVRMAAAHATVATGAAARRLQAEAEEARMAARQAAVREAAVARVAARQAAAREEAEARMAARQAAAREEAVARVVARAAARVITRQVGAPRAAAEAVRATGARSLLGLRARGEMNHEQLQRVLAQHAEANREPAPHLLFRT